MEKGKGAALGAAMLSALSADPVLAEGAKVDPMPTASVEQSQSWDLSQKCGLQVKAIIDDQNLRAEPNFRKRAAGLVGDCRRAQLLGVQAQQEATLADQEEVLAGLNGLLVEQNMRIDELRVIRAANGEELAKIEQVNGKLRVRRQNAETNTAQILDDIERFILSQ